LRRYIVRFLWPALSLLQRPLHDFKYNVYSQNGEDGVVAELFRRLGIRDGWLVEFGAWDGVHLSNTYYLIEQNSRFRAVYIEGDSERYEQLNSTAGKFSGRIIPIHAFVQPDGDQSLKKLLNSARIPDDFELLSVDVDGLDYQIWERLTDYAPKVVIIEINSSIPPGQEQVHGEQGQGSSFSSLLRLGHRKGYACVCHIGNLFFVRNDLLTKVGLKEKYLSDPELLFSKAWLTPQSHRK
jgi:hypothetical protein